MIAHHYRIDLANHGLTGEQLERVRILRADGAAPVDDSAQASLPAPTPADPPPRDAEARPLTPALQFDSRQPHAAVVRTSKRRFVNRHYMDAVRAAFTSVNNRVRRLSGDNERDGQSLMAQVFNEDRPVLQMTDLTDQSERNEQAGLKFLMMGAMRGLRNPRAHEDDWSPDSDPASVLECLAFASLLHRFLDRCQEYQQSPS